MDNVEALSVYLPSIAGDMQVLNNHIPVIVVLKAGNIVVETVAKIKVLIPVDYGYAQFSNNQMTVVVIDTKLSPEELEAIQQNAIQNKSKNIIDDETITESEFFNKEESERNI